MYLSVLAGLTQLFAIHENGEGVLPLILPDQEVSTMLQTVLGNADTSLGKYPVYIHVGEQRQIYLILFFWFFTASSGFKHPFAIHESDNNMITNHGNSAIFASNQSLAYTPDSMGLELKKRYVQHGCMALQ